ncbi:NUDIX family hydrolase [Natrialba magadii ATCC 43099]|uniref:NUDIX family hydrolase n=1 Tax=Natrialba magadii (strain ATCC 43099 / DSM 3394 / CCM 3739 / CIP 104546 / IAM 13178 / JCM 8861 / NBRC 102185 / NCIMB 2190 / MS3) TaxID=547559 RepID=D3SZ38_NATMM|nr:NUDIX hydrolase [Natrialba magadii]ADD06230.1 NUDIX family hydrolase [Natrialba magadii ATCC 43099]ELY31055.1 NUDIX hydrolase [Natrialba magadii ATCC 43099]
MPTDPLAWETTDREVAYTCPGFDIVNESVRLPDGTETDFDYLSEPSSVCILPFTPDGDVVCIDEWRQAVARVNRGLPVGGTEPDDTDLEAAARRELREETGYEADRMEPLVTVEPANGIADSVLHVFVAEDCQPTAEQELDHNESIRVEPVAFETVLESLLAGDIRDGRLALALSYYQLQEETE